LNHLLNNSANIEKNPKEPYVSVLPHVCIVIPTFYAGQALKLVLHSIAELDYPRDRISTTVVADTNDDEAKKYVNEVKETGTLNVDLKLLETPNADIERNYGLRHSPDRFVMLVDDDTLLEKNCLKKALEIILSDQHIAAVAFPAMPKYPRIDEKLNYGRFIGAQTSVNAVSPCTLFRMDALEEVGFYREDMGPPNSIHEDWELGSRLEKHGYRVVIDGTVVLNHVYDLTDRKKDPQKFHLDKKDVKYMGLRSPISKSINYVKGYATKHWWSMLQVLKVSPLSQLLEYVFYFMNPILLLILILNNRFYSSTYFVSIFVLIIFWSFFKGHYKTYGYNDRFGYPIILFVVRSVRTYAFIIGLTLNAFKNKIYKGVSEF